MPFPAPDSLSLPHNFYFTIRQYYYSLAPKMHVLKEIKEST
jgi:hypothetical protein